MHRFPHLILLLPLFFISTPCFAEWIGAFFLHTKSLDSARLSVAEDGDFDSATRLFIWQKDPLRQVPMKIETIKASKFVIFHVDKSKHEILKEWVQFYLSSRNRLSLYSKNCAWASQHVLNKILHLNYNEHILVFARGFYGIPIPDYGIGITLPDAVRLRLIHHFEKSNLHFFTENDGRGETLIEQLRQYHSNTK